MQNLIIDKPYVFVPPSRSAFWPIVSRPLLRPYLARACGVTHVEFTGMEPLRNALRERASVVLVPNHCRPCDPTIISVLGAEAGTPIYTMASWHVFMGKRFTAWVLRQLGGFSVYREGMDRAAIKAAIELLVEDRRPLVIFAEGYISRANDRLGAFNEGPAFIARSAAKQRAKSDPGHRTLLVPIAIRYRFLGNLEESVAPILDRIETHLTWTPRRDLPLIERLQRAGSALLGLKELQFFGEVRQGAIHERLDRLINDLLVPLEEEWKIKKPEGDVPARVRALRTAILPDMVEGNITDAERDRRWEQFARLYLAQQLCLYPSGYLEGNPTQERILETVERMEEDLTDVATVHRPMSATVHVGEPIEVKESDRALDALMNEVRSRIEGLLKADATTRPVQETR